ncbi:MAG: glycosyltransferase [Lachnospiraceae bacterium]|nr:glycosyltransferase [Lachnospiraceae bacterium]
MSNIKVSVLCLAYNHEKYIRKALDGFVSQITNFSYEVLINDDCSTDGTAEIIKEYQNKYPEIIKPIFQEENCYSKGINMFIDILLPRSKGKYIALCECDDYWCDNSKLQKQFDALEEHPECVMATHKNQDCTEPGELIDDYTPKTYLHIVGTRIFTGNDLLRILLIESVNPFHTSTMFMRREVLEVDISYPRDTGILRRALMLGGIYYIDEIMSIYRKFSIGSYTSLIKEKGGLSLEYYLNEIENELLFDRESEHRFQDAVMCRTLALVHCLFLFDLKLAQKYFKKDYPAYKKAYLVWKNDVPRNIWRDLVALKVGIPVYKILRFLAKVKTIIINKTGIKTDHKVYGLYT